MARTYKKHALTKHPIYRVWIAMKQRCYYRKHVRFSHYGGVGIHICREWRSNFKAFYEWALNNGWESGLTIDRIDGRLSYYPQNCRFVTKAVNNRNKSKAMRRNPLRWIVAPYHPSSYEKICLM
jgi:hypothetical protein